MSRGRGYRGGSSGGGRGGSTNYRGSSSARYHGTSRSVNEFTHYGNQTNNRGVSSGRYFMGSSGSYINQYNSSRGNSKYPTSVSTDRYSDGHRHEDNRRPIRLSSRDRSLERKRLRHDVYAPSLNRRSTDYGQFAAVGGGYTGNRYDGISLGSYNRNRSGQRLPQITHDVGNRMQPPNTPSRYNSSSGSNCNRRSRERIGLSKRLTVPVSRSIIGVSTRSTLSCNENNSRSSPIRRGNNNTRGVVRSSRGIIRRTSELRSRKVFPTMKTREYVKRLKIARMRSSIKKRTFTGKTVVKKRRSTSITNKDMIENGEDDVDMDMEIASKSVESLADKKHKKSASLTPSTSNQQKKCLENNIDNDAVAIVHENSSAKTMDRNIKNDGSLESDEKKIVSRVSKVSRDNDAIEKKPTIMQNTPTKRSKFIQLTCVHCNIKCVQFKEFNSHLYGRIHKVALRRLAVRQRAQLSRMRLAQRNAQRKLEEVSNDNGEVSSQFCLLCRLNYRQPKAEHQASEAHRNMKKFLMPYCNICRIGFKSPMVYETHRCSLEHIKRKARKEQSEVSDDERELDMNQFTTVDSVGDIDGHNLVDDELTALSVETTGIQSSDKDKLEITVGSDHVKRVEVYFCDLCRFYLPYQEEQESALKRHCSTRSHLRAYLRHRDNQYLKKEAEKVHRQNLEEKAVNIKDHITEGGVGLGKSDDTKLEVDENEDDKIWDDVGKDLGDLLRELPENGQHEDDDDNVSLGGNLRYDRFKISELSDKNKNDISDDKGHLKIEDKFAVNNVPEKIDEIAEDIKTEEENQSVFEK